MTTMLTNPVSGVKRTNWIQTMQALTTVMSKCHGMHLFQELVRKLCAAIATTILTCCEEFYCY